MKNQGFRIVRLIAILLPAALALGCDGSSARMSAPFLAQGVPLVQVTAGPQAGGATELSTPPAAPEAGQSTGNESEVPAPAGPDPGQAVPVPVPQEPASSPTLPALSPGVEEVVKLARAGISEAVVLSYVTNSTNLFAIGPDEIVYLRDLGLSSEVIQALILKDASPENAERRRLAAAAVPLPTEAALTQPAPNVYPQAEGDSNRVHVPPWPQVEGEAVVQEQPGTAPDGAEVYQPGEEEPMPAEVASFYEPLSPYGTWYKTAEYGYVWQPTVATIDYEWLPYSHHGRWLWTTQGWYWYSHYSWGWAPFHYGRWCVYPRMGWVWVPGVVWGPAWVSWRYNKFYCGWAPLPPYCNYLTGYGLYYNGGLVSAHFGFGLGYHHYTYISFSHFYDHHPHHYYEPHHRKKGIHAETTVINNYINGDNNTIINEGIGLERVANATRGEIQTVQVRNRTQNVGLMERREQLRSEGPNPVVEVPPLSGSGGSARAASAASLSGAPSGTTPLASRRGTLSPGRGAAGSVPAEGSSASEPNPASGQSLSTTPPPGGQESSRIPASGLTRSGVRTMAPSTGAAAGEGASTPANTRISQPRGQPQSSRPTSQSIVQTPRSPSVPVAVPGEGTTSGAAAGRVPAPSRTRDAVQPSRSFRVYPGTPRSAQPRTDAPAVPPSQRESQAPGARAPEAAPQAAPAARPGTSVSQPRGTTRSTPAVRGAPPSFTRPSAPTAGPSRRSTIQPAPARPSAPPAAPRVTPPVRSQPAPRLAAPRTAPSPSRSAPPPSMQRAPSRSAPPSARTPSPTMGAPSRAGGGQRGGRP